MFDDISIFRPTTLMLNCPWTFFNKVTEKIDNDVNIQLLKWSIYNLKKLKD